MSHLALAGLRIELEKRLRALGMKAGLGGDQSERSLRQSLCDRHVLNESTVEGIIEILEAGNRATHGAIADREVYEWALSVGPRLLAALDYQLHKDDIQEPQEKLKRALTVISFAQELEGPDALTRASFREHCISWLDLAKRDEYTKVIPGFASRKERAAKALIQLGALEPLVGSGSDSYQISGFGEMLLSHLLAQ